MNNIKFPPGLLRDIRENRPALFLGAGSSICVKLSEKERLPLGDTIIESLLKYLYQSDESIETLKQRFSQKYNIEGEITPEVVWSIVLAEKGEGLLPHTRILMELFNKSKPVPPNYKYIARMVLNDIFSTVITTNFDEKLDQAFDRVSKESVKIRQFYIACDEDDFKFFGRAYRKPALKMIYKLHGTLSRPHTIQSSREDVKKLSVRKKRLLKEIFEDNEKIIFIGYSCRDQDIFDALIEIGKELKDEIPRSGKIWWVDINRNKRIDKILDLFRSKQNFYQQDSYMFLKELDTTFWGTLEHPFAGRREMPEKKFVKDYGVKIIKSLFKKEFSIRDPIYGIIKFDEDISKIISKIVNSGDFQRLRDIKQLALLQYRYPGGTNTRFSHSIGVAFLVWKALKNLYEEKIIDDYDIIRSGTCAALLHDIGHGPFSHVIELFAKRTGKSYSHEKMTIEILDYPLLDLGEIFDEIPIAKNQVKEILRHSFLTNIEELDIDFENIFVSQLIGGYAIDFDRVDFLLRDAYYCGIPFSMANLNNLESRSELIEKLTQNIDVFSPEDKNYRFLCFHEKIKDDIKFLLDLYVNMYLNIYRSETDVCIKAMIAKALQLADELGDINIRDLVTLTDSELFTFLENSESCVVRELSWAVKYRRLFKKQFEFIPYFKPDSTPLDESAIERTIVENLSIDEENEFNKLVLVSIHTPKELGPLFFKNEDNKILDLRNSECYKKRQQKLNENLRGYVFLPWNHKLSTSELNEIKEILSGFCIKVINFS